MHNVRKYNVFYKTVFLVLMKDNVVIFTEHEPPCNVPGILTTTIHSKYGLCFAHRD